MPGTPATSCPGSSRWRVRRDARDWTRIDDEARTICIEGTVVRIPGQRLIVQPHTKSKAGMRTITPPSWISTSCSDATRPPKGSGCSRRSAAPLRDPDNTRGRLRAAVKGTEWEGLHPHAFRHLVAARLDRAGISAREIADYLGHERISMTQDVYMTRGITGYRRRGRTRPAGTGSMSGDKGWSLPGRFRW